MPTVLALDIGTRKSGIALSIDSINVPVSLPTFKGTFTSFLPYLLDVIQKHSPSIIVVGLPYLLEGTKGMQANFVEKCVTTLKSKISDRNITVVTLDERFSSFEKEFDNDAAAAISLLTTFLKRNNIV